MDEPTPAEVDLLKSIHTLTEQHDGRPPSLAEVAVSMGLRASSRANVQRQLAQLRPVFVEWTNTPRSLRLTPAGNVLIGQTGTVSSPNDTLLPDVVLPLLASGLTQISQDLESNRYVQAPYPSSWQRGMNILSANCLLRGAEPPKHSVETWQWCHRPLNTWPVRFSGQFRFLEHPLLEEGQPTDFCRELAQGLPKGEAELELSERLMGRIRHDAELRRDQTAYVAVRRYLIEHPVVSLEDLLRNSFDPAMSAFGGELMEMYEVVPHTVAEQGQVLLCGHCGWTLIRREGRLQCGDDRCRVLTANFTRNTRWRQVTSEAPLHRVRRAIRRYVVAAGIYELEAAQSLGALGLSVELWPHFDRYDLRLSFSTGEAWAVDVKDWRFPHLLARRLHPFVNERGDIWSRSIYAIPDSRVAENPNYLTFLKNAAVLQDFEVMTISELTAAARTRKQVLDA